MASWFHFQTTIPRVLRTAQAQYIIHDCFHASTAPLRMSLSRKFATSSRGSLHGKKCLITGASRGIGRAIALRFAAEDASCVLVGRNVSAIEDVAAELKNQGKVSGTKESGDRAQHEVRVADVGDRAFWADAAKELKDIDILINAAGIAHSSLLFATKPELIENVYRTNLLGTTWACQALAKNMIRRRTGCIINVSSLLGLSGGRGSAAYAASKAGVLGLTRALAGELGQSGIRVNAIVPGYIETQMTDANPPAVASTDRYLTHVCNQVAKVHLDMTETARAQALDAIPMKRFGKVDEIADAAVFLALNEYANNCVVNLDGGLSAV